MYLTIKRKDLRVFWIVIGMSLFSSCKIASSSCSPPISFNRSHLGHRLDGYLLTEMALAILSECAKQCFYQTNCHSLSFNKVRSRCLLHSVNSTSAAPTALVEDPLFVYTDVSVWPKSMVGTCGGKPCASGERCLPLGRAHTCIQQPGPDWYPVFRGVSGNNIDVYQSYHDGVSTTADGACKRLDDTSCTLNYRNPIIDKWQLIGLEQVKFGLYKNGTEVAFVTFNGTGSNITNWFAKENILDSTWTDLAAHDYLFFSAEGNSRGRQFYINIDYNGCPNDPTYTLVVAPNTTSTCNYDKHQPAYPQFLYSTTASYGHPAHLIGFDKADCMAISIK